LNVDGCPYQRNEQNATPEIHGTSCSLSYVVRIVASWLSCQGVKSVLFMCLPFDGSQTDTAVFAVDINGTAGSDVICSSVAPDL
jgi:hypothetical protein